MALLSKARRRRLQLRRRVKKALSKLRGVRPKRRKVY